MTGNKFQKENFEKAARELETDQSAKDRQYQKFVEKARELETDESEENFDRVLKKVVKAPPPKEHKEEQQREPKRWPFP